MTQLLKTTTQFNDATWPSHKTLCFKSRSSGLNYLISKRSNHRPFQSVNLLEQPKSFINVKYFVFFLFKFRLINLKTNNYLCFIFYYFYDLIQVIVHLFNETAELSLLPTPLLK